MNLWPEEFFLFLSFKRLYIIKGLLVLVEKASFRKNLDANFNAVKRVRDCPMFDWISILLSFLGANTQLRPNVNTLTLLVPTSIE